MLNHIASFFYIWAECISNYNPGCVVRLLYWIQEKKYEYMSEVTKLKIV